MEKAIYHAPYTIEVTVSIKRKVCAVSDGVLSDYDSSTLDNGDDF